MSNSSRFESRSAAETAQFAETMAVNAKPGGCYALFGGLGAGKTVFAQGFARGLGYTGRVTSPTFTLMNEYAGGRLTVFHFDLYRLGGATTELDGIGYEDYFYADGVCLVEWAERAEELLPADAVKIRFIQGEDENSRSIIVEY